MNTIIRSEKKINYLKATIQKLSDEYKYTKKVFISKIILQGLILLALALLVANWIIVESEGGTILTSICCLVEGYRIFKASKKFIYCRRVVKEYLDNLKLDLFIAKEIRRCEILNIFINDSLNKNKEN